MSQQEPVPSREIAYPLLLIVAGLVGLTAAFALTVDKFVQLQNPDAALGCDFSLIVQCGRNLASWQGSLFGWGVPVLWGASKLLQALSPLELRLFPLFASLWWHRLVARRIAGRGHPVKR